MSVIGVAVSTVASLQDGYRFRSGSSACGDSLHATFRFLPQSSVWEGMACVLGWTGGLAKLNSCLSGWRTRTISWKQHLFIEKVLKRMLVMWKRTKLCKRCCFHSLVVSVFVWGNDMGTDNRTKPSEEKAAIVPCAGFHRFHGNGGWGDLEPLSKWLEIPVQPKVDSFRLETFVWKQGLTQCMIWGSEVIVMWLLSLLIIRTPLTL